jgi:hypothetical protein
MSLACGFAIPASAASRKPVQALVLTSNFEKPDAELEKRLQAEGIQLVTRKLSEPLSLDMLKLFDAVIVPDFNGLVTPFFVPSNVVVEYYDTKRNIEELHRYVEAGGGVWFSPCMNGAGPEAAEGCDALLAPWGAAVLAAQVRDEVNTNANPTNKAGKATYAWTTAFKRSPVTEGLKRLWYPINMLRWDDAYATVSLVLKDKAWDTIVKGMRGSTAAYGLQYETWIPVEGMKEPAIVATRVQGKGRVALVAISPFYTFWTPFHSPGQGWVGESNTGPIDGIFMEKGDGVNPSDGFRLIVNTLQWLAAGAQSAGLGGYTADALAKLPKPARSPLPGWLGNWNEGNGAQPIKVLIGPRSTFSDGKGTIPEYATAARAAGYGIMVMTETFERMDPKSWLAFCAACRAATTNDLVVMPGLDIADTYQNRFLLFGSWTWPAAFMLSPDGKSLKEPQFLSLGFGTHFTAIHRPSTTPLPHQLYKFFSGLSLYTYRGGKLVDDGLLAYQWQVDNESAPIPLVVHEVYDAAAISALPTSAVHNVFVYADTVQNAAWYLRAGMAHFWETPSKFLVSAGPMVRALGWGTIVADGAELTTPRPERAGQIVADSKVPITEVRLVSHYDTERRWFPNTNRIDLSYHLPPSHARWAYVYMKDAQGRTAITPMLRGGPAPRYSWRCSDRQNFFGYAAIYTGTILPDFDLQVPVFGADEGRGLWPHQNERRGDNLAPLLEFPYTSPAVTVTDGFVDQRYWRAAWQDVVFDAKGSQGTSRSRVYQAHVRYYDFNVNEQYREKDGARPLMLKEVSIRLRMPAAPEGPIFPSFTSVSRNAEYGWTDAQTGAAVTGRVGKGWIDLPPGGYADDFIALSPGLRVGADGQIGFAPPAGWTGGPLPVGHEWSARYVKAPKGERDSLRAALGMSGKPPFTLTLSQGTLDSLLYVAWMKADKFAIRGEVAPAAAMPFPLPLFIQGINPHWPSAVMRDDGVPVYFGVLEGMAMARLDVTRKGPFYAGNVLMAGEPQVRLSIVQWDGKGIRFEAHNPTTADIGTVVETPEGLAGKYRLKETVAIPAGKSVLLEFPAVKE